MDVLNSKLSQDSRYKSVHWMMTQTSALLIILILTMIAIVQESEKFSWGFVCVPVLIPYCFLIRKFCWSFSDWQNESKRQILSLIGLFFFLPVFLFTYAIVWQPLLSIKWYKSTRCSLKGQFTTTLPNFERYSLSYVLINEDFLGISCVSNQKTSTNYMKGYQFYERGESFQCDASFFGDFSENNESDSPDSEERVLSQFLSEQKYSKEQNLESKCRSKYNFSTVKMPSWLCSTVEENKILLSKTSESDRPVEVSCHFAYYGRNGYGKQNGRSSKDLKNEADFVMIRLDEELYYNEHLFISLLGFVFYPGILFICQFPLSKLNYSIIEGLYQEEIVEENEELEAQRVIKRAQNPDGSRYEETSIADREKQVLHPSQIIKILTPRSQQKDRDFYDIYKNSRVDINSVKFETDLIGMSVPFSNTATMNQSKAEFIDQDQKACMNIEDIDDLKRIQGGGDIIDDQNELEVTSVDQESSYTKIRKIYKRKLDPDYQSEQKQKKKLGIPVENVEIQIIKEIKKSINQNHQQPINDVDFPKIGSTMDTASKEDKEKDIPNAPESLAKMEEKYQKYADSLDNSKQIDSQPAENPLLE